MLWDFWAKTGLVDSSLEMQGFGKLFRGLIQGLHKGKALGGKGDYHSAIGEVVSGLT